MKRITELLNDPHKQTELYSLGQAGFIIKNRSGFTIAIDPYLSDYTEKTEGNMGFKRLLPKILEPGDFEFDIVITTHAHSDHFDFDSVHAYMDGNKT